MSLDKPIIVIVLADLHGGGAECVSINLADELVRRGLSVDMVLMRPSGELLPKLNTRVRVVGLRAPRVCNVLFLWMSYLRRTQPMGLLVYMWPLTIIAPLVKHLAWVKTRIISGVHPAWPTSAQAYEKGFMQRVSLSTWSGYHLTDGVAPVSADDAGVLAQPTRDHVGVIYNPIVGATDDRKGRSAWTVTGTTVLNCVMRRDDAGGAANEEVGGQAPTGAVVAGMSVRNVGFRRAPP